MAIKGSPFGEFFQEGLYSTVGSMLEPLDVEITLFLAVGFRVLSLDELSL